MATAIMDLLRNPEKAVAMGKRGKKEVQEKFTVETMVKKYEELYFSLLKDRAEGLRPGILRISEKSRNL